MGTMTRLARRAYERCIDWERGKGYNVMILDQSKQNFKEKSKINE